MTSTGTSNNFAVRTRLGADTIVALIGELDLATVGSFEAVLDELDFSSIRRVLLDLDRLDFIDGRGLRAILRLHASCVEQSVTLAISPGPRAVQRVFELTQTDMVLPFAPRTAPGSSRRVCRR